SQGVTVFSSTPGFNFRLFPNPCGGNEINIFYSTPHSGLTTIALYDITGALRLKKRFNFTKINRQTLNLASIPNGIYWVRLQQAQRVLVQKLVVNRQ
ncbi:MAG: T9SS type A sorting domain-containing protein, partial [candidate division WOR-3 bacterium]|nr:T9SS type A sorting domain-containing protein [candidate division WOR-3 bacterium]